MSREFNGSTDRIDWANIADLAGSPLTISLWLYVDTFNPGHIQYAFNMGIAGDDYGDNIAFYDTTNANNQIRFLRRGTTFEERYSDIGQGGPVTTWYHVLVTHDGTFTDYTTIHVYVNGTEVTYATTGGGQNGVTETAKIGKWSLGGRVLDDLRNFGGKIAEIGVWNTVLDGATITALASGKTPSFYPTDLLFYYSANTNTLVAEVGGTGTADGSTYNASHPTMEQPPSYIDTQASASTASGDVTTTTTTYLRTYITTTIYTVMGGSYYIDPSSGDDDDSGTFDEPWQTLAKAVSSAPAYSVVYLREGTYNEQAKFTVPLALIGYPGETAVIDGTGVTMGSYTGLVDFNGDVGTHINGVIVKDLTIRDAGQNSTHEYNGIYMRYVDNITIDNCIIDNIVDSGIMLRNCNTFTIKDTIVKDAANCTANMDENISISGSTYGYIYDNTVYATITQNDGNGIGICAKDGCDYIWIHDNTVYSCYNNGIYVCGWTSPVSHIWVYDNTIHDVDGIWVASEAGEDVDSVYIYDNICYRFNYAAIHISSTDSNGPRSNIYICNNTVDYALDNGGAGILVTTDNLSGTILIRNNVTYINEGTNGQVRVLDTALAKCTIDHNIVYGVNDYDPDNVTHYNEVATPANETRGSDPLFTNRAAHIYTLQAGSPCRNAGAAWTGQPSTDMAGDPRSSGAAIDVGAYEYQE